MRAPHCSLPGAALATLVLLSGTRRAAAEIGAEPLLEALATPRALGGVTPSVTSASPWFFAGGRVSVLVHEREPGALGAAGLREVAPGFAAAELTATELRALAERAGLTLTWSPPLRPALDRVGGWISLDPARSPGETTGRGVIIGIIDTAFDPAHGDLRGPGGALRTAYYVDFSASGGPQAELEEEYCTATGGSCAIYAAADLQALLDNPIVGDEPNDPIGHGTHVASLAAGSGHASIDGRYVGVAPEATLVAVRLLRSDGSIRETDVVRAARFVFERAEALGMPAVLNLSLGTDFGAHDGSSPLELALARLVGPEHPGRAVVIAAGNAGETFDVPGGPYPGPFGIHTELRVPAGTSARVPLLTPSLGDTVRGSLFVWIGCRPGDELAVGLDHRSGTWIAPVPRGQSATYTSDTLEIALVNEPAHREDAEVGQDAAALIIHGEWPAETVFAIRLEGSGTARLWVQSAGVFGLESGSLGGLFAAASPRATVNLPATHPSLIAVGATVNRDRWSSLSSGEIVVDAAAGALAAFSGAGPTATGHLKPDIVAPGDYVVGAMAFAADPRWNSGSGLFASTADCTFEDCRVVDDFHAVASGTSMSAPLVSGAVALLLERDPGLDQERLRALLQAGATPLAGGARAGAGLLDVERSFAALAGGVAVAGEPSAEASSLVLADDFARPGGDEVLHGLLRLRDSEGAIADGAEPNALTLAVDNGAVVEPLARQAPGSYTFALRANAGSGGRNLTVRALRDGAVLARATVPIAIDRHLAEGVARARGGCAIAAVGGAGAAGAGAGAAILSALLVALVAVARSRGRRAVVVST